MGAGMMLEQLNTIFSWHCKASPPGGWSHKSLLTSEQLRMLRTGHSTTSGVRSYKHVGEKLKHVTSDILNGTKKFKQDSEYLEGVGASW